MILLFGFCSFALERACCAGEFAGRLVRDDPRGFTTEPMKWLLGLCLLSLVKSRAGEGKTEITKAES
jgi:hypothetical protein